MEKGDYTTDDLSEAAAILATGIGNYSITRNGSPWASIVFHQDVSELVQKYRAGLLMVSALAYTNIMRRLRREVRMESGEGEKVWGRRR